MSDTICKDCGKRIGSDSIHTCSPQLKAPSVPSSVQEITRLIQPYVAACLKFNYTPMELIEQAEADVNEAFKPLEAALTALVEKNHELQFSLDGVRAMRRPEWQPIETAPKDGTYVLLGSAADGGSWVGKYEPQYQSGWRPENPWSSMMLNCRHLPKRYSLLKPTDWQPMPPPPISGVESEREEVRS